MPYHPPPSPHHPPPSPTNIHQAPSSPIVAQHPPSDPIIMAVWRYGGMATGGGAVWQYGGAPGASGSPIIPYHPPASPTITQHHPSGSPIIPTIPPPSPTKPHQHPPSPTIHHHPPSSPSNPHHPPSDLIIVAVWRYGGTSKTPFIPHPLTHYSPSSPIKPHHHGGMAVWRYGPFPLLFLDNPAPPPPLPRESLSHPLSHSTNSLLPCPTAPVPFSLIIPPPLPPPFSSFHPPSSIAVIWLCGSMAVWALPRAVWCKSSTRQHQECQGAFASE